MKSAVLTVCIALFANGFVRADLVPDDPYFPFVKGRYWLYDGNVAYMDQGAVREKKITGWKSEVVDTFENKDFKAALLKGSPRDLAWYADARERRDTICILTRAGEFSEIMGEARIPDEFAVIKDTGKLPDALLGRCEALFKVPMKEGDRLGDPEQIRLGPRYCWVVSSITTGVAEPQVKGIPAAKQLTTYCLTYRSSPEHFNLHFAAGVGITFYEYVHHGTKGDCVMQLVETGISGGSK